MHCVILCGVKQWYLIIMRHDLCNFFVGQARGSKVNARDNLAVMFRESLKAKRMPFVCHDNRLSWSLLECSRVIFHISLMMPPSSCDDDDETLYESGALLSEQFGIP